MFDIGSLFTEKMSTQRGTVSAFHQDGTIEVTPSRGAAVTCFILKNGCEEHSFSLEDTVLFVKDSSDEYGYILGVVSRYLPVVEESEIKTETVQLSEKPRHARVDGKVITIEAQSQIELKCGKSSITLQNDGKILFKGANLVSRSSGTNKIKGGSVSIN